MLLFIKTVQMYILFLTKKYFSHFLTKIIEKLNTNYELLTKLSIIPLNNTPILPRLL